MTYDSNVSLKDYCTMRLGGNAAFLCKVNNNKELIEAINWASDRKLETLMIGGGSNIIWQDSGFSGLVIVNQISGYSVVEEGINNTTVKIGAGENWDKVVERSVESNLHGIESLSLVPGSAGATPIQNVGAYGQEISETLLSLEAWDSETKQMTEIKGEECDFSYRSSRFKKQDKGRYYITSITLGLSKDMPKPPFYESLDSYLKINKITDYTPQTIRDAVIAIRQAKLPDPKIVANTGSFFGNPIITEEKCNELIKEYPDLPHWSTDDAQFKLSAGWLIEQAGFKNYRDKTTGMAIWPKQSLVLVNEDAKTTANLLAFKQNIVEGIENKFGITLVQEPEMLP